ncbi:MAG: metal-sulfur cluster assembly factor [Planctomycetota bacterium]
MLTREEILERLKPVVDPEIGISIVELGLVYGVELEEDERRVTVRMTLTTPLCPYGPALAGQVRDIVAAIPGVDEAKVDLVWDPPWDPRAMASDEAKDQLMIW